MSDTFSNVSKNKIALYRYDGADCLAVADGSPMALVDRSSAVELMEAVSAIGLN